MPGACFFLTRGHWCSRPNRFRAILPARCPSRFTLPCGVRGYDEDGFVCPLEDGKGMRFLRYSAPLFILCAVLAACGGGGGGGGVTPPGGGGGGGGGGGSTPSPAHSSSPSPTPTVTPTATPSGGVPVDKYFALNAGVGPQANPPPQNNQIWYNVGTTAHWTTPPNNPSVTAFGDTSATNANDANGFTSVDGQLCTAQNDNAGGYAVHSFVAIYYNNNGNWQELQLPSGIGMQNPQEPIAYPTSPPQTSDYFQIQNWQCEYPVHTHDFSGLVHIVRNDKPQDQPLSPLSDFGYNLQNLFDIWGITYDAANGLTIPAGDGNPAITLAGPVSIYYGTQGNDKDQKNNYLTDSYQLLSGPLAPSNVPLAWHDT